MGDVIIDFKYIKSESSPLPTTLSKISVLVSINSLKNIEKEYLRKGYYIR